MTQPAPVVHAAAWFPPRQVGGTEIYVQGLVEALATLGRPGVVLVPRDLEDLAPYRYASVDVVPYPRLAQVGAAAQAASLAAIFKANPGSIYHQHSWTPDCGLDQLRLARDEGCRTVLTVHVPSVVCLRGTMMLFGQAQCSGDLNREPCPACWAQSRGAPRPLAELLARWPTPVGKLMPARLRTAATARERLAERRADVEEIVQTADTVVAVCSWLHQALAANGVPTERLLLSRQGVGAPFDAITSSQRRGDAQPRRLLFLGRWDAVKGVDVVVRALVQQPKLPLTLSIHAIAGGAAEERYRMQVESLALGDDRIKFHPPAVRSALPALMAEHDALVVPSVWLETGPLVALEAQAAGLFVIGSDLGGVAELIDQPDKGRLVRSGDVGAWAQALREFAAVGPPPAIPRPVRSMADAAQDMAALYARLAQR